MSASILNENQVNSGRDVVLGELQFCQVRLAVLCNIVINIGFATVHVELVENLHTARVNSRKCESGLSHHSSQHH